MNRKESAGTLAQGKCARGKNGRIYFQSCHALPSRICFQSPWRRAFHFPTRQKRSACGAAADSPVSSGRRLAPSSAVGARRVSGGGQAPG